MRLPIIATLLLSACALPDLGLPEEAAGGGDYPDLVPMETILAADPPAIDAGLAGRVAADGAGLRSRAGAVAPVPTGDLAERGRGLRSRAASLDRDALTGDDRRRLAEAAERLRAAGGE